jgi:nucleotide-binding universal stress UspA family protein
MLRSILIGIDDSASGIAAQELALCWAKRLGAQLTGLAIADDPGIRLCTVVMNRRVYDLPAAGTLTAEPRHKAREGLRAAKNQFAERCREAGVELELVDELGLPSVQILLEAQQHDAIVLGSESRLDQERNGERGQLLCQVLHDSPRPVIAVPPASGGGDSILVAYDGSLQASRALLAFQASGLVQGKPVHVVAVDSGRHDAAHRAMRAVTFLSRHEVEATPYVVEAPAAPADAILEKVQELDAGLLVMGAYGQPVLREFCLGSVTRTVLKESPVPIFLSH